MALAYVGLVLTLINLANTIEYCGSKSVNSLSFYKLFQNERSSSV